MEYEIILTQKEEAIVRALARQILPKLVACYPALSEEALHRHALSALTVLHEAIVQDSFISMTGPLETDLILHYSGKFL